MKINTIKFVKYISLKTNYNKKNDDIFMQTMKMSIYVKTF